MKAILITIFSFAFMSTISFGQNTGTVQKTTVKIETPKLKVEDGKKKKKVRAKFKTAEDKKKQKKKRAKFKAADGEKPEKRK